MALLPKPLFCPSLCIFITFDTYCFVTIIAFFSAMVPPQLSYLHAGEIKMYQTKEALKIYQPRS